MGSITAQIAASTNTSAAAGAPSAAATATAIETTAAGAAPNTSPWYSTPTATGTTSYTSTQLTTGPLVSMPLPEFERYNEVWSDDEERTRGRDSFPIVMADIIGHNAQDSRYNYNIDVLRDRPALIRGANNGSSDMSDRNSNFREVISVMISTGPLDDPPIVRPGLQHPLQEDIIGHNLPRTLPEPPQTDTTIYDNLTEQLQIIVHPISRAIDLLKNDPFTMQPMRLLLDVWSPNAVDNWGLLVMMMASLHPVQSDKDHSIAIGQVFNDKYGLSPPGFLSIRRAGTMLIGRRGIVHGWGAPMPDIKREILREIPLKYVYPPEWGPNSDTDGYSSYQSDSPGIDYEDSNDEFSGPRGVVPSRPPVTGLSSVSASSDSDESGNLSMFSGGGPSTPEKRTLFLKFVKYLKKSNQERRDRRSIRRARRLERRKYDTQRRLAEPVFDMEAKRAEALASEKTRNEIRQRQQNRARDLEFRNLKRTISNDDEFINSANVYTNTVATERQNIFLQKIRTRIFNKWIKQADCRIIKLQDKLEDDEKEMKFLCWMTPVHWVKQTGPK